MCVVMNLEEGVRFIIGGRGSWKFFVVSVWNLI